MTTVDEAVAAEATLVNPDPTEHVVVVGIDDSGTAGEAALWAADEAQRRGVGLLMMHGYVVPAVELTVPMMLPEVEAAVHAAGMAILAEAQQVVRRIHPGLLVTTQLEQSSPVRMLRTASETAALTVVGSHGGHQAAEALLGSVAARVAEHAYGAIVVVRTNAGEAEPSVGGPVLIGLDGSAESEVALAFAFQEAALRRVALIAIRAWDDGALQGFTNVYPLLIDPDSIDKEEGRLLAEQLAPWESKFPDVLVRPMVLRGKPAAMLVACCTEPDRSGTLPALAVVGSRGRGAFAGMLLGSTSRMLVAHAPCAVAVVRPDH